MYVGDVSMLNRGLLFVLNPAADLFRRYGKCHKGRGEKESRRT